MAKSTRKSEFHPCAIFSTGTLLRDGRNAKRQFHAFQCKDQLRELCNCQKITTAINTLDGSALGGQSSFEPPSRLCVLSAHSS